MLKIHYYNLTLLYMTEESGQILEIIDKIKDNKVIKDGTYLNLCNLLKKVRSKLEVKVQKEGLIHKLYIIGYKEWKYVKLNNIWQLKSEIKEQLLMSGVKNDVGNLFGYFQYSTNSNSYEGKEIFIDTQNHYFGLLNPCELNIDKSLLSNQILPYKPFRKTQIINNIEVEIPLPILLYTKEFCDPEAIKYKT